MKQRRSATDPNKPYKCDFPGCGRAFFHRQNLWHHRRNMGHAKAKKGAAQASPVVQHRGNRPVEETMAQQHGFQLQPGIEAGLKTENHGFHLQPGIEAGLKTENQGFGSWICRMDLPCWILDYCRFDHLWTNT